MRRVIVIGGGASGMVAAYFSAKEGNEVVLFEKNEKLGKKLYITGKGRCNLTNDISVEEFFDNVVSNPKFLYGSIYSFPPEKTIAFFENFGLKLKTERGNRVFPLSDKASDVTKALERALKGVDAEICLNTEISVVKVSNGEVTGVKLKNGDFVEADSVIVCTGGVSYPLTGSTGDGYKIAAAVGHSLVKPVSALVGLDLKGKDFLPLQGLSLKNVRLTISDGKKNVVSEFGEMLFTHFGISGPIVLSCSSYINRLPAEKLSAVIDLKPALSEEVLDNRLQREFAEYNTKSISGIARSLLPAALIETVLKQAGISPTKKCSEITKEERKSLVFSLKNLTFSIKGLRPIEEAIVTAGGVNVNEINPKTMESKLVKNLYFAGEVLDVDCLTGGFNLQVAFATGYIAGENA